MVNPFPTDKVFRSLSEKEEKFAPSHLFLSGRLELLRVGVRVSVIGARNSSADGIRRSRKLVHWLIQKGIIVVSGLAHGIDTAAHKAAIEANGKTIAVIGSPISIFYPPENRDLQTNIARDHLLISQFPDETPVIRSNFTMRNRLMMLISDATVIVEAEDGSGTIHSGWEAIRLGRPLWIAKSAVDDVTLTWPNKLLRYGAKILSEESLHEFEVSLVSMQNSQ